MTAVDPASPTSRSVVLDLLCSSREFPTRAFPDAATKAGLEARDRAFARAMLAGSIRRGRTLDAIIKPFSKRGKLDPNVRWTLRLGLYQRFFLEGVPPYAAFDATIEAAKPRFNSRVLGFINAVLRSADRAATEEKPASNEPAAERAGMKRRKPKPSRVCSA